MGIYRNNNSSREMQWTEVQGQFAVSLSALWRKENETGACQPLAGNSFELRMYDSRIGRWMTTDPANQYASPYLAMGNNPIQRIDPDGGNDIPPVDDAAFLSNLIYNEDLEVGTFYTGPSGIQYELLKLHVGTGGDGTRIGLFTDGTEYVAAAAGTDPTSVEDWAANFKNFFGAESLQYWHARVTAGRDIDQFVGESELTFTGHSLGGGIAIYLALTYEKKAITFNASGVSQRSYNYSAFKTRREVKQYAKENIDAFIVKGEAVDYYTGLFKPAIGNRIMMDAAQLNTIKTRIGLHLMHHVRAALELEKNEELIPNYLK